MNKINITHAQAAELMQLFSDSEPDTVVTLIVGDETAHSGPGLYALYDEYPEEGSTKLDAIELPPEQNWTDDQMIKFAWMILNHSSIPEQHAKSIAERMEMFKTLEQKLDAFDPTKHGGEFPPYPKPKKPMSDADIEFATSHIYHRGRPTDLDFRKALIQKAEEFHGIIKP